MKKILEYPRACFAIVIAMQTALLINSRALWFSDEIRYANAYSNLANMGKWVVLYLNGEPYPDKPPFYFWTVWVVQNLSSLDLPSAMFLTSALTGFLYLLAHYFFSMTVTGSKKISTISGLILLSNFFFIGLLNYVRMDLLFAALIIISYTYMYKFMQTGEAKYSYITFIVASIAALTKGPLACILPVMFFFFAVIINTEFRKFKNKHLYIGMLVAMLPILGWLLGIIMVEGYDFLSSLIYKQVYKRAVSTWHHAEPFYYYSYAFTLMWMPWVFVMFTGGFKELFRNTVQFFKRGQGEKYVMVAIVSTLIFLSMLSGKISIYALPMFSPFAVYIAYMLIKTEKTKTFWRSSSVFMIILGIVLFIIKFLPEVPAGISGNYISGFAAIAVAGVIWVMAEKELHKSLITFVLSITLFFNVLGLTLIPSLDISMSPEKQAGLMKTYISEGYKPVAYKVYSGIYTYYSGSDVYETKDLEEVTKMVSSDKKIVLGIAEKYWKKWDTKPDSLKIVDKQWIAGRDYLLVLNK